MSLYLNGIAVFLLIVLLGGLVRVVLGPTYADRMLASQLFGSVGVALLMLLAVIQQQMALLNAALVLALLAPLTLITFINLVTFNKPSSSNTPCSSNKSFSSNKSGDKSA
ncbi:MAG: multiple resistance and pH regulation protein F [Kangiellaceae bacterium]|jgi:multicomponent Na+:H+ antiporter subunit F|nr:multiple resistance and pH regulation protein F [Kangiellaceae bacterium]|tara:strand:+ start:6323 stop:6652 length:330 start_codon:yes stop_codon:yes gene_type:complete